MRSLATALILTERDADGEENTPKVKGRIITTLPKAKEVRPFIERCVNLARKALVHQRAAAELGTDAVRNSDAWREWRKSPRWQEWNRAIAPVVAARRRVLQLLGNKQAVRVLFDQIAERYSDRNGGYTRILHLATPRLGDASPRAILEFVGQNDRLRRKAPRPSIEPESPRPVVEPEAKGTETAPAAEPPRETPTPEAS